MVDFLSGLSGGLGAILGYIGQEETNDANIMLARENRQFTADQSNSGYQRAVNDMKAAGLNPALMFGRGQAASTPQLEAPRVENELGRAVSSGLQAAQATSSLQQANALIDKTAAETQNVKADTLIKMVQPENVKAMTAMYSATTAKELANEALMREQIPTIKPLASARIAADTSSAYNFMKQGDFADARRKNEAASFGQGYLGREAGSVRQYLQEFGDRLGRRPLRFLPNRSQSSDDPRGMSDYVNPMP
jgi:hypothetical protein